MSAKPSFSLKDFEPDPDLEKHLMAGGFKVHSVNFRHVDLIQSLVYMSTYVHDAVKGNNPIKSNTMLITVDDKNECILCSAGSYHPPSTLENESNTAIVHGSKTSYFVTNGFLIDNFELVKPTSDYITEDGEILITRNDIEARTKSSL